MKNKEEIEIRQILLKMDITSNTLGYHYILEAIKILRKQGIHTNTITLYEIIEKRLHAKSTSAVEKAIRYSIETSWTKNTILTKIYSKKPVVSAFLYDLVFNFDIFLKVAEEN